MSHYLTNVDATALNGVKHWSVRKDDAAVSCFLMAQPFVLITYEDHASSPLGVINNSVDSACFPKMQTT